jgi:hypothetical protein
MPNDTFIIVNNGKTTIIGDYYYFEDGLMLDYE